MQPKTLDVLRRSDLVKEIVSVDFDAIGDSHKLKIRARLKNNWLIDLVGTRGSGVAAIFLPCLLQE